LTGTTPTTGDDEFGEVGDEAAVLAVAEESDRGAAVDLDDFGTFSELEPSDRVANPPKY
jgi:hypothetical protein